MERGLSEGGNRNRIVVSGGDGYLVFSGSRGGAQWLCQVSAGRQLPARVKLSPQQSQQLADYGLAQLRASENFREKFQTEPEQLDDWSRKALRIMESVFGAHEAEIAIRLESVPELDRKTIDEAMELVARKRNLSARSGLYMVLARSQLVIAVDETPASGELRDATFRVCDELGGRPVAAIFSNYNALDAYEPRGLDGLTVGGGELFPWLIEQKVGSVLINPGSAPRGELYANELMTLGEGIRRMMH